MFVIHFLKKFAKHYNLCYIGHNCINCMLYREYNICCYWYSFTEELKFFRELFRQVGYPEATFANCVYVLLTRNSFNAKIQYNTIQYNTLFNV